MKSTSFELRIPAYRRFLRISGFEKQIRSSVLGTIGSKHLTSSKQLEQDSKTDILFVLLSISRLSNLPADGTSSHRKSERGERLYIGHYNLQDEETNLGIDAAVI